MVMILSDSLSAMKTILYARVSTLDQTIAHQRKQAEGAGFKIDAVVADEGVSGVHVPLAERPQGKRLFDLLRAGDTLVVRWVDRLGRNYADVSDTIREFIRRGVVIKTVINNMVFDGSTKDPMQQAVRDALIAFMAATAQSPRPKPQKRPKRPESTMPRPSAMDAIRAGNLPTPANNIRPFATCFPKRRQSPPLPKVRV
jgi:putative DNA-invertase from lambdoid prophage Rac